MCVKHVSFILREEHRLRVIKNRMLRKIFGCKRDKVTGKRRRLQNKELYDLYSAPNIIWVIKSRRVRWVGHVARMGDSRGACSMLLGRLKGRGHLEDPGIDGRSTLKWIFKKSDGEA